MLRAEIRTVYPFELNFLSCPIKLSAWRSGSKQLKKKKKSHYFLSSLKFLSSRLVKYWKRGPVGIVGEVMLGDVPNPVVEGSGQPSLTLRSAFLWVGIGPDGSSCASKLSYFAIPWQNEPCQTQTYIAEVCVGLPYRLLISSTYLGRRVKLGIFYLLDTNITHTFPFRYVRTGGRSSNFKLRW